MEDGPDQGTMMRGQNRRAATEEAAAEERKGEGASCTTLRIPSPPAFTGRDACFRALSSRCVLPTIDLSTASHKTLEVGGEKTGRRPEEVQQLWDGERVAKE